MNYCGKVHGDACISNRASVPKLITMQWWQYISQFIQLQSPSASETRAGKKAADPQTTSNFDMGSSSPQRS